MVIDKVVRDLENAQRELAEMSTVQQIGQEEYYGTTNKGDEVRKSLREKICELKEIIKALE